MVYSHLVTQAIFMLKPGALEAADFIPSIILQNFYIHPEPMRSPRILHSQCVLHTIYLCTVLCVRIWKNIRKSFLNGCILWEIGRYIIILVALTLADIFLFVCTIIWLFGFIQNIICFCVHFSLLFHLLLLSLWIPFIYTIVEPMELNASTQKKTKFLNF